MLAVHVRNRRLGLGLALGLPVGFVQYAIDGAGMRAAGRAEGLSGIGVAATWAAVYLGCSLVMLLVVCRVLEVPLWAAVALGLCLGQLVVVAVLWDAVGHVGVHGAARAWLFTATAGVLVAATALVPPRRTGD